MMTSSRQFAVALILAAFAAFSPESEAQETKPSKTSKVTEDEEVYSYKDELGFFQKANRDLSDPRFMFHDDKAKLDLGFGGTAKVECGCSIFGTLDQYVFKPLSIDVPTDPSSGFGGRIAGSELHFKGRATLGKRNIIAFVKIGGDDNNKLELSQVYLSYGGLSFGKIPSFFTDLEYGIRTETMIATQVNRTHILAGYRHRFCKNALELGFSVEEPTLDMTGYNLDHVYTNYQKIPDFVLRVKYKWKSGHVQFGLLGRSLSYWTCDPQKEVPIYSVDGIDVSRFGYGCSLSGNYCPAKKIKLTAAFVGGAGISHYLEGMANYNMDLYLSSETSKTGVVMNPLPVFSGTLGLEYNWTPKIYSGIMGQYMCAFDQQDDTHGITNYKNSLMTTVTTFWNIKDFFYVGLEYIFGFRNNYDTKHDGRTFGQSHRISIMAAYQF